MSRYIILPSSEAIPKSHEGFSLTPYRCPTGHWTQGWGSTRRLDGSPVTQTSPKITPLEAQQMLDADLAIALAAINRLVTRPNLTQNQVDALIAFTDNEGVGHLAASHLLIQVNGYADKAVPAEFAKWVYGDVGGVEKILPGLVTRRAEEAALYAASVTA